MYPYYASNGFPDFSEYGFMLLIFCECIFAIDIIHKFFLQELDEVGKTMNQPLEIIAENYYKG